MSGIVALKPRNGLQGISFFEIPENLVFWGWRSGVVFFGLRLRLRSVPFLWRLIIVLRGCGFFAFLFLLLRVDFRDNRAGEIRVDSDVEIQAAFPADFEFQASGIGKVGLANKWSLVDCVKKGGSGIDPTGEFRFGLSFFFLIFFPINFFLLLLVLLLFDLWIGQ